MGNGNAGTANVARSVGILPAMIVLIVDFSKGALPVITAHQLKLNDACALSGAIAAVIGHSFPIFFRFRGGKGLAASLGALLTFSPLETFLVMPIFGLIYLVITGSAVTGAIISFLLLIGFNLWRGRPLIIAFAPLVFLFTLGICTIPQIIQDWQKRTDRKHLLEYWFSPKIKASKPAHIVVITDSIASLPNDLCSQEHIHVIPLALIMPEGQYQDGVNIDARQYYRRLRQDNLSPKTSAPSPGQFQAAFQQLSKIYREGIVITPPQELTQVYESALIGADLVKEDFPVEVIDSRTAGPAQGFVALAAARAIKTGADMKTVLDVIQETKKNVGFIGALNTVRLLIEGGRVANIHHFLQSAFHFYPTLYIHEGQIQLISITRTKNKSMDRMISWLKENVPTTGIAIAIAHTDNPQEAAELEKKLLENFQPTELFTTELSPVIGAHAGPGLLGIAWWINPISPDNLFCK